MAKLKVAAIQACSQADDFDHKWQGADVKHALDLLDKAAAQRANLACFPELYPLVGEKELRDKARDLGIYIIAGLADGTQKRWRNTSSVISPKGEISAARRRTIQPRSNWTMASFPATPSMYSKPPLVVSASSFAQTLLSSTTA